MRKSERMTFKGLRIFLLCIFLYVTGKPLPVNAQVIRKKTIEFYSSDSLLITADHYFSNKNNPYILLFHQENSSRGEFDSIADRFVKMKYNCLVVDLRNGDKFAYTENHTARRAKEKNFPTGLTTEHDIIAAIDFAGNLTENKIILLGSSWSASLCLKVASEDERIKAVMAFSPGEFLQPTYPLKKLFTRLQKPVYIAVSPQEYPYLRDAIDQMPEGSLSMITPPEKSVARGIPMLYSEHPGSDEYWLSVLIFIKSLRN
ncbi:MAG: dienelactone hydrolase family protein [Bacteroidales bacterium]|nr:dienelactone hydrolase family protein [Bacteroidales bacterium]